LLKGPSLTFHHSGEEVELTPNLPEAICPYADQESTLTENGHSQLYSSSSAPE
jgi:hypothetical protein